MDILELGTPRLTYRRLYNLISHLPRESATAWAMAGPPHPWDDSDYLLAMLVDGINFLGWAYARVHSKGGSRKPPDPVRRPGETRRGDLIMTVNQQRRETYSGGSMSFAELDAVIEAQTGSPRGIARGVD